ncbi:MAG: hypothetical protein PVH99_18910, partial [Desulfobacteraceae bacterium]
MLFLLSNLSSFYYERLALDTQRQAGAKTSLQMRLSENAHLPFDKPYDRLTVLSKVEGLMALSKVEGLRYPHPSSLRRTSMYASFLGISE